MTPQITGEEGLLARDEVYDWRLTAGFDVQTHLVPNFLNAPGRARVHPDDLQPVEDRLKACLSGADNTFAVRYRVVDANGAVTYLYTRACVVSRANTVRLTGAVTDITCLILSGCPDAIGLEAIMLCDACNRIAAVNPAFTRLTGYDIDDVAGLDPLVLSSDRHDEAFRRQLWQTLQTTDQWEGELWNRKKDGSVFAASWSIRAIRNPGGEVSHYIGRCTDISSHKTIENKLRLQRDIQHLISEFAAGFLTAGTGHFDESVQPVLERSAVHLGASRSYVVLFSEDRRQLSCVYEWCTPEVTPQLQRMQHLTIDYTMWWWQELAEKGVVLIPDVAEMPEAAAFEKQWLVEQKVRSTCAFAAHHAGTLTGFIGYETIHGPREWSKEMIDSAKLIGDVVGAAFGHESTYRALQRSETRYRLLFESLSDSIVVSDTATYQIVAANQQAVNLTGWSADALEGMRLFDLHPAEMLGEVEKQVIRCMQTTGSESTTEMLLRCADGRDIPVEVSSGGCYTERGRVLIVGIFRDITEQKRVERERARALINLKKAESLARVGNWMLDPSSGEMTWSEGMFQILGLDAAAEHPSLHLFLERLHPEERQTVFDLMRSKIEHSEAFDIEHRICLANGDAKHVELRGEVVCASDGSVLYASGTIQDVTERVRYQNQLERLAYFDNLTGLPNRALLTRELNHDMEEVRGGERKLVLGILDVDDFKSINDLHGRRAGDALLNELGRRLIEIADAHTTVARLAGDEFGIAVNRIEEDKGMLLVSKIFDTVTLPFQFEAQTIRFSISLGVTVFPRRPHNESDADQLMRQAQQALYQAKLSGKNQYYLFDSTQEYETRAFHKNLQDIRDGLAADEFVVYYQPKVNMRTGEIFGAEALIRWQHPYRGLLLPDEFLPVVKNHPLGIELDFWVLDNVLKQLKNWSALGLNINVSVNVSAYQLQQQDFLERLTAILEAHPGVPLNLLQLEVLESSAMRDIKQVSMTMDACRALGISFALDDFGTGYSSLTYLKSLPATVVKIDQSFVRGMLDHPDDFAIIKGVLGMAKAFGLQIIAEGVETIEHGEMLLRLGCMLAQGYVISKPMRAESLPGWIAVWRVDPQWRNLSMLTGDKLAILNVAVEIRFWIRSVEEIFAAREKKSRIPDYRHTPFGRWLLEEGQHHYGGSSEYQTIRSLSRELYESAQALLEKGIPFSDLQRHRALRDFYGLRDQLLGALKTLINVNTPSAAAIKTI